MLSLLLFLSSSEDEISASEVTGTGLKSDGQLQAVEDEKG